MPIGTMPCLLPEVFSQFNVKDYMSCDFLISHQLVGVSFVGLKINADVLHFYPYRIFPKCITVFLVYLFCLLHRLGIPNPVFVVFSQYFVLNLAMILFRLLST